MFDLGGLELAPPAGLEPFQGQSCVTAAVKAAAGSRSVPAVGRLLLTVVGALLRALAKDVAQLRLLRGATATRGKPARPRIVGSEWAKVGERCVADTSFRALVRLDRRIVVASEVNRADPVRARSEPSINLNHRGRRPAHTLEWLNVSFAFARPYAGGPTSVTRAIH